MACNRCGRASIQYEVHFHCARCDHGSFHVCLACYRLARGCRHWFGFGRAAWARFERHAPPDGHAPHPEPPHTLVARRYLMPLHPAVPSPTAPGRSVTSEDPARRLEAGVFCDVCLGFANACYWTCDTCNDGAWGFCNPCVNQGRHCTHPLLPVAHARSDDADAPRSPSLAPAAHDTGASPPRTPKAATAAQPGAPGALVVGALVFVALVFRSDCDVCKLAIPAAHARFHCLHCNGGDYDVCAACYRALAAAARIAPHNAAAGWRRCLRGHRMVVVGFDAANRRRVLRDLVGGRALRDDDAPDARALAPTPAWSWRDSDGSLHQARSPCSASPPLPPPSPPPSQHQQHQHQPQKRFPPDGGVGLRVLALWSYYPAPGVADELLFPKNAEIREAEDINGDWFWGCYAGAKGLFPGNYGRVLGGGS